MKNIPGKKPIVVDVRHPRDRKYTNKQSGYFSRAGWLPKEEVKIKPRLRFLKFAFMFFVLLPFVAIGAYSGYLWVNKGDMMKSAHEVYYGLKFVREHLFQLETDSITSSIVNIDGELKNLEQVTKYLRIAPILRDIPATIDKTRVLVDRIGSINENIDRLKTGGVGIFFEGSEQEFISILKATREDILEAQSIIGELANRPYGFGNSLINQNLDYVAIDSLINRFGGGLDAFIDILEAPGKSYIALAFENPTEIRPGGGFTGSFGVMVIENGEVIDIEIDDIYHPDKFSQYNIIPPLQLQTITPDWGARDANWFFDFPTSGSKFIEFLEKSDNYKNRGVEFEGVIAINVRVMEGILDIIGAIEIPEYDLTLDSSNFLPEIQEEVEEGRDKIPGQNPKRVLSFIAPVVIEKLKSLENEEKEKVAELISHNFENKNIKFYFKDRAIQSIFVHHGGAGDVFRTPTSFVGDYLAVVNANIAGGKSDAFISQDIELDSVISANGEVRNKLKVTRTHSGQDEEKWWYRATNNNFIKIFTPERSRLAYIDGNNSKTISPLVDYKNSDFSVDKDLLAIESTLSNMDEFNVQRYEEFGKYSFGTWLNTPAGETRVLNMTYFNSKKINTRDGLKYTFVFDKQSGVESQFKYTLEAPPGFVWKESGSRIYSYSSNSLPARLMLELTLLVQN